MKNVLLAAGILLIAAGILCLLVAVLSRFGVSHVMDGSATLYEKLHRRMIAFSVTGAALVLAGAVSLFCRFYG